MLWEVCVDSFGDRYTDSFLFLLRLTKYKIKVNYLLPTFQRIQIPVSVYILGFCVGTGQCEKDVSGFVGRG